MNLPASVAAPAVSIVVATFNRSQLLAHAIRSVRAQTFADWEMIVIGDACTDDTEKVVAGFGDPRICFENLPVNYGEQSGPNNIGVKRARGRYIAYLNHDDLWFPDHLAVAVEWLEATGADLVATGSAGIRPLDRDRLHAGLWQVGLGSQGRRGFYDPIRTIMCASTLVMTRALIDRVGPWRPAAEGHAESSQDFLFRAWRSGAALRTAPYLTVVLIPSGEREGSYRDRAAIEHDYFSARLATDPDALRLALVERIPPKRERRGLLRIADRVMQASLRGLARLGLYSRDFRFRFERRMKRGEHIERLRRKRGLAPLVSRDPTPDDLRSYYRSRLPAYRLGETVDHSSKGDGEERKQ